MTTMVRSSAAAFCVFAAAATSAVSGCANEAQEGDPVASQSSAQLGEIESKGSVEVFTAGGITFATASFTADQEDPCIRTTLGACNVAVCAPDFPDQDATGTPADAGKITIKGGAVPLTLVPVNHTYPPAFNPTTLFQGGELLSIRGEGSPGGAPPFWRFVIAPTPITLTSPALLPNPLPGQPDLGNRLHLSRTQDLDVTWTGGGHGEVRVFVAHFANDGAPPVPGGVAVAVRKTLQSVECTFDPQAGKGTIPAQALNFFPAGADAHFEVEARAVSRARRRHGWTIRQNATGGGNPAVPFSSEQVVFD